MEKYDNNFYDYDEKESKLRFYSDEFESLLLKCGIIMEDIELDIENGNICCFAEINYKKINCNKFDEKLKEKVPYIQDVFLEDGYFIMTFNVKHIELS